MIVPDLSQLVVDILRGANVIAFLYRIAILIIGFLSQESALRIVCPLNDLPVIKSDFCGQIEMVVQDGRFAIGIIGDIAVVVVLISSTALYIQPKLLLVRPGAIRYFLNPVGVGKILV